MKKTNIIHRLFACVLAISFLVGAVPYQAEAKSTESSAKLYAVEITTGAAGVDVSNLQSIIINYKSDGKSRCYVENMNNRKDSTTGTYLNLALYGRDSDSDVADYDVNCKKWVSTYLSSYVAYQTQTFFFRPYDTIDTIESIQILTADSGSWEIQGMRVIEVKESSLGAKQISKSSPIAIPCYSGTRLAEMSGNLNLQWGQSKLVTVKAKTSKADAYLETMNDAYQSYKKSDDNYWLQLKIADEYMAGLESIDLADQKSVATDMLLATIYYKDIYGDTRVAQIPVLSSLVKEAGKNVDAIKALAQQGNTLMVSCKLPGFSELITDAKSGNSGVKLTLSYSKTVDQCYINEESDVDQLSSGSTEKTVVTRADSMRDQLSLTGIALYKASEVSVSTDVSGGELAFKVSGGSSKSAVPEYYYSYKNSSGRAITYGEEQSFAMQDNRTEKKTISSDSTADVSNLYLVEIDTSDVSGAASAGDLSVSFSYTAYGSVATSDQSAGEQTSAVTESTTYDVRTKVREFYGYWPALQGDTSAQSYMEDFGYYKGMLGGGKLQFLISLSNVDTFQSMTLTLKNGQQWQASGVKISRVTGLKHRTLTLEDVSMITADNQSLTVNHSINREVTSTELASASQAILFRSGESKTINFSDSQSTVDDSDTTEVLDPTIEEMTYEEACKNKGYNKSRVTYDVDVTVAGSNGSDSANGDSGSKNLFYFKLNFENGSSAYVLANQQLSSDGFRAGETERFSIAMNQSYGELISVDIIPDDSSSNSDIYDKLNIDKIRVTRNNNTAVSRTWEITSPGWVGVDYKEEADTEKSGRYEGEIAQSYQVDNSTYGLRLLFAITTGTYDKGEKQFHGTVQATLRYTDSSGQTQTLNFDLVKRLYDFAGLTPSEANSESAYYTSDTSTMFRGGSCDRFYLNLSDVKSVDSLKLTVQDEEGTTWKIQNVGVSLVTTSKILYINDRGEYDYTGEKEELTSQANESEPAYTINTAKGSQTDVTINFKGNEISINSSNSDSNQADTTITRKPSGTNDTVNLFVQPKLSNGQQLSNFSVKTELNYVNSFGRYFINGISDMKVSGNGYFAAGLSVTNFAQLKRARVIATAKSGTKELYGDKLIVQHVRAGTLLNTYEVDNENTKLSESSYSDQITEITNKETQAVTLYFGDATQKQILEESGRNVAVSIGFKTSLGDNDQTYHSPYVYLTDEQYEMLTHNMMAEVEFHIPYIKEITDIRIAGIDDVEAVVESATVGTYTNDGSADIEKPVADASEETWKTYESSVKKAKDSRTLTGWYSFGINAQLNNEAQTFTPTNTNTAEVGALVPVTLTLKPQDTGMDSDIDLALTVHYISDSDGTEQTKVIPSVKQWVDDSSIFTSDDPVSLSLMLSDVAAITGVTVRTTVSGTSYPLDKMVLSWNRYGTLGSTTRSVMKTINAQGYQISMLSGTFTVTATSVPADGSQGITLPTDNVTEMNFALSKGDGLSVTAIYSATSSGDRVTYALYKKESSGAVSTIRNAVSIEGYVYKVTTDNLEAGDYELHFFSSMSQTESVVKFTLKE